MRSAILQTASRYLQPVLLLFSVFLLLRGHNVSGGGFVAGLVAASGYALHSLANDVRDARRALRVDPRLLLAIGLLLVLVSAALGPLAGAPVLQGLWLEVHINGLGDLHLGTPLLFDIGVFLTVIGVTVTIVFALEEAE